jgi:hypothetical protein
MCQLSCASLADFNDRFGENAMQRRDQLSNLANTPRQFWLQPDQAALSAHRHVGCQNAARSTNGWSGEAAAQHQGIRLKSARGRTRCCTCKQTWLAVAGLNVAGGLIVFAVWDKTWTFLSLTKSTVWLEGRRSLDIVMLRVPQIAETRYGHWHRTDPCGSCARSQSPPGSRWRNGTP